MTELDTFKYSKTDTWNIFVLNRMNVLIGVSLLIFNLMIVVGHINDIVRFNKLTDDHSIELTQSLNLARQELIQEACSRFPPKETLDQLTSAQLQHILIDEKHKLLYCYVPKVACTNWKRILMILSGQWNSTDILSIPANLAHSPGLFKNLSSVPKHERDYMIDNYHKLIIVRNPFERLLSAYRNKLEGKTQSARYFQDRVGRRIVRAFRANASAEALSHGHDVSFKEFVLLLTSETGALAELARNEHWQPATALCHPCLLNYTLVGKYETLVEDSTLALHAVGAPGLQFPRLARPSGTARRLAQYYAQLPLPLVRTLYKKYQLDYRIFDYHLDDIVGFDLG